MRVTAMNADTLGACSRKCWVVYVRVWGERRSFLLWDTNHEAYLRRKVDEKFGEGTEIISVERFK